MGTSRKRLLRGWQDPKAYPLSVAGGALLLVGLLVVDSVLLSLAGAVLMIFGWLVSRRAK